VPQHHDGIDPDALDAAWRRARDGGRRVKLLYLIPNFQNPTGALLSLEKRQRIIDWASVDLTSGILDQRLAHAAVTHGLLDRLAPALRARYRLKRDVMEGAIRREIGDRLRWESPKGGFFLWVTLPQGCSDTDLFARALEEQVVFVVGSAFHVDGSGHDTIRLSYSEPAPERIEEGVRRLARVLTPARAR
jgi:DNA-binding transcriptional MocR family regulator